MAGICMNERIPTFINAQAGSAAQLLPLLRADARLDLYELSPDELVEGIQTAMRHGAKRIIVSGGDGTLALAAATVIGSDTELAILPGGTLNHFAGRYQIPTDINAALALAMSGTAQRVDVGYVNERLFLNTSSVGFYVRFVQTRNHLEKRMNYYSASLLAGLRHLIRLRTAHLRLNNRVIQSPLVFVGVGERDLSFPAVGKEVPDGEKGLHLLAVRSRNRWETLKVVWHMLWGSTDPLKQAHGVENAVIPALTMRFPHSWRRLYVALDGELALLHTPLYYRYAPDSLAVVIPSPNAA